MTDVIVQQLETDQKVRIRCKDYVKKIAVYKDKLAVQLPDKLVIYQKIESDDPDDMQYRMMTTIEDNLKCNLLVITSHHVILCMEKKLLLYTMEGKKERTWSMDSVIRYIKVNGGPEKGEGVAGGSQGWHVPENFHQQRLSCGARQPRRVRSVPRHVGVQEEAGCGG